MHGALSPDEQPVPMDWWCRFEGWQAQAGPTDEPPLVGRADTGAWTGHQHTQYALDRRRARVRPLVPAPAVSRAITRGRSLLVTNRRAAAAQRQHLVISGPPGSGASRVGLELARAVRAADLLRRPPSSDHDARCRHTVAYLAAPHRADADALTQALHDFFYEPHWHRGQDLTAVMATLLLPQMQTQLVIVDRAENIGADHASAARTVEELDARFPVTFVYVYRDQDIPSAERDDPLQVPVTALAPGPDWDKAVQALDDQVRLLDHVPGTLTALAGPLHELTAGAIGTLCRTVHAAQRHAIGSAREHLTWTALQLAATRPQPGTLAL